MSYLTMLLIGLSIFLLTFILLPLNIKFSKRFGFISIPNSRSMHSNIQPSSGGLSIALPLILVEILLFFVLKDKILALDLLKLACGGSLILILGILDDRYNLKARYKLILQVIIALVMFFLGFKIQLLTNPLGEAIDISILSFPISIFWFLIIMNAINLIDGLDGLAIGITIITCAVLMITSFYFKHNLVFLITTMLCASSFAFLYYNYPPSKIFMGDTGSLFIGFQLAAISVLGNTQLKGLTTMNLLIPITVLFVPLFDTILSILRRIKKKQNVFQADKDHIHHRMLNIGFSTKTVMYIAWFITSLFAVISLGYIYANKHIMIIMLLILTLILGALFYFLLRKEFFK